MKSTDLTVKIVIPVLSLLVALTSIVSTIYIQNKQIESSFKTTEMQVKYNEKRKAYSNLLTYVTKSYLDATNNKFDQLQSDIDNLLTNYYVMEPLFEDDFVYVYRLLIGSDGIPENFNLNKYYTKVKTPQEWRCTNKDFKNHPLGALVANLNGIQNMKGNSSGRKKGPTLDIQYDDVEETLGKNYQDIVQFLKTEVYYKLFVEKR